MKNYTRSGYVRSRTTGRLTGYAQSQTDSKDMIVLETSRGNDGVLRTLITVSGDGSGGLPAGMRIEARWPAPRWRNRLPDALAVPLHHLAAMARHRFYLEPFVMVDRRWYLLVTAWQQLRQHLA